MNATFMLWSVSRTLQPFILKHMKIVQHSTLLVVTFILLVLGVSTTTASAAPVFSVSKRGTYTASSKIEAYLAGSLLDSDTATGVRFVIGQNSVNIKSGGAVITLTPDNKLTLKIGAAYAMGFTATGNGTWKWTNATTLTMNGTAKIVMPQGTVNATWTSSVKFPSAGKATFKLTANGTFSGFPIKLTIDAIAQK